MFSLICGMKVTEYMSLCTDETSSYLHLHVKNLDLAILSEMVSMALVIMPMVQIIAQVPAECEGSIRAVE